MTKIWAHRGASAYAPENTLPAFELAIAQGADGVELDVQRTADGHLVVVHDETVDRTSDGTGRVVDLTVAELRRLDFGDGARIPLLDEVLRLCAPTGMVVNVELKTSIELYPGIEQEARDVVEAAGMGERVVFSSFNHYTLAGLRGQVAPERLGLLFADGIHEPWEYARRFGAGALHPGLHLLQLPGYVERAHEAGLLVHVWTVNDPGHMALVAAAGVDAVITNHPDAAAAALR
ncbi:glycerophosphodiester phosphodiesterase [Tessaracoccus oleiagri]|uniref:Glycerophosphoryl diester phosphodiesterase n=1 Tax=Tessaracoccus oleiagri TaxID=686624 RepID=A0A1G9HCW0_9ACTN|nr:glycerophosphodiester phosphodiesterase [Tessaracoccus oleiagri]SDL10554.1 glycerophosphoryl diester phosphodiesterase [Tessaracoccus oleiagri]